MADENEKSHRAQPQQAHQMLQDDPRAVMVDIRSRWSSSSSATLRRRPHRLDRRARLDRQSALRHDIRKLLLGA